jgi:1,4-dihydroxy-2-naphthoyl-CoA hydrolase
MGSPAEAGAQDAEGAGDGGSARRPARPLPLHRVLDAHLGFALLELTGDRAVAELPVTDRVRQRLGIVHGGTYAAVAEFLASEGTVTAVHAAGNIAMGIENSTYFLRAVTDGRLRAEGRPVHRGLTLWIWDVQFTDEQGRLCATSRVTLMVRPAPKGAPPLVRPGDLPAR